jgi:hypothetical protein
MTSLTEWLEIKGLEGENTTTLDLTIYCREFIFYILTIDNKIVFKDKILKQ